MTKTHPRPPESQEGASYAIQRRFNRRGGRSSPWRGPPVTVATPCRPGREPRRLSQCPLCSEATELLRCHELTGCANFGNSPESRFNQVRHLRVCGSDRFVG